MGFDSCRRYTEAAPLWRSARAQIQLRLNEEEGRKDASASASTSRGLTEAGLVQLFYASWCFMEEPSDDESTRGSESMRETVRMIHEYCASSAQVVGARGGGHQRGTSVKTSELQRSVAAAAEELRGVTCAGHGSVRAVEVEMEARVARLLSLDTQQQKNTFFSPPAQRKAATRPRGGGKYALFIELEKW